MLSSFSSPIPERSTLPSPSGQPSPSASSRFATYCRLRFANEYISSRNASSPVQRHTSATALGNLTVSSVLKSYVVVPSGFVCRESWPNQIDPSATASCTTTPLPGLRISEMSRSARRWSSIARNCPTATLANAVYSASVPKIQG